MKTKYLSWRFLLMLMAMMVALNAGALTETITGSNKLILKYSISGGKYIRTLEGNAHASIFEIEPGGTITITGANGRKQTKKDKFDYWITARVYFVDAKGKQLGEPHYKVQENGNVQLQVIVPDGAVKAEARISLKCSDIYNSLGAEGEFMLQDGETSFGFHLGLACHLNNMEAERSLNNTHLTHCIVHHKLVEVIHHHAIGKPIQVAALFSGTLIG